MTDFDEHWDTRLGLLTGLISGVGINKQGKSWLG